jgi:3-dehydroquinate synthetase
VGLPTQIGDIPGDLPAAQDVVRLMRQDKKVRQGRLTLVLINGIGEAFTTRDVEPAQIVDFLARIAG